MRKLGAIVGIVGLVGVLGATETRVWTLAQGNVGFLYDDEVIVNFFPSQMFNFGNHYTLESALIPGSSVLGFYRYASLKYTMDNLGFGAFLGRTHSVNFDYDAFTMDVTPLDLLFGYNFGAGAFGLNFAFGTSSYLDTTGTDDNRSATLFRFLPSLTLNMGENAGLDLGLNFTLTSGKHKVGTNVTEKVSGTDIVVNARYYNPVFIIPVAFVISNSNDEVDADNYTKVSNMQFNLGLAKHLNFENGFAYGGLIFGFGSTTTTVAVTGNKSETSASILGLGLLFGGEFKLWRELYTRASLAYNVFASYNGNPKFSSLGLPGGFTLGVGYDFGLFRADFAISTDLIQNGPYFLTGNPSAFVTMFSLLGHF